MIGSINEEEIKVYEKTFGANMDQLEKLSFFNNIKYFILLNTEPSKCKNRVEEVRKREAEKVKS